MPIMPAQERATDRAALRATRATIELAAEMRAARLAHGLSQAAVGRAIGLSQPRVSLIERGGWPAVPLLVLARMCAAVGLDLSARAFPGGQPIRDAAHLALLGRLRSRLSPAFRWRSEVPLPIPGDGRAWDALITGAGISIGIEAETRITDVQALERRVALKKRDGGAARVVLLVRDSRWNRSVLRRHADLLEPAFPLPGPVALRAIAAGRDPGGDSLILL